MNEDQRQALATCYDRLAEEHEQMAKRWREAAEALRGVTEIADEDYRDEPVAAVNLSDHDSDFTLGRVYKITSTDHRGYNLRDDDDHPRWRTKAMDKVRERPILFNDAMVRALLVGTKTQTRRVVKPQPFSDDIDNLGDCKTIIDMPTGRHIVCPYGQPGDRLWVRETWCQAWDMDRDEWFDPPRAHYRADGYEVCHVDDLERSPWRPSIHMPRWASRITLQITDVRVERLQEIMRGDCMAEGCPFPNMSDGPDPRQWFADLWESIKGPDSWKANPWVWVIEFEKVNKGDE